jgi:hypothetical protein
LRTEDGRFVSASCSPAAGVLPDMTSYLGFANGNGEQEAVWAIRKAIRSKESPAMIFEG